MSRLKSNCIIASGARQPNGYCRSTLNGFRDYAHRNAWRKAFGQIPEGQCVLHHCDNPPCINPSHLWIGTQQENLTDMARKGRWRFGTLIGKDHPNAVLNEILAMSIIRDSKAGLSEEELRTKYGVSKGTINNIRTGQHWAVRALRHHT